MDGDATIGTLRVDRSACKRVVDRDPSADALHQGAGQKCCGSEAAYMDTTDPTPDT
jgi:hypothetical protein